DEGALKRLEVSHRITAEAATEGPHGRRTAAALNPLLLARAEASRWTQPKAVRTSGHDASAASRPSPRIARRHVCSFGSPFWRPPVQAVGDLRQPIPQLQPR